jgi:hypothetical protein
MAGSLSTDLHNKLLDHILKTTPFVVPTNIYAALFSVAPTIAGGGTELTGNGYARIVHNSWDAAAAGASENTGVITFAAASGGDWLEAVALGLFDAITGGNFLGWADLTVARTVLDGDNAEFADGELDVSMSA